jgi:hypothetical protein
MLGCLLRALVGENDHALWETARSGFPSMLRPEHRVVLQNYFENKPHVIEQAELMGRYNRVKK